MKTVKTKECYYCKSVEGLPRPVGNYIVELKEMDTPDGMKLVCQSCYLHKKFKKTKVLENPFKSKLIESIKKIF